MLESGVMMEAIVTQVIFVDCVQLLEPVSRLVSTTNRYSMPAFLIGFSCPMSSSKLRIK